MAATTGKKSNKAPGSTEENEKKNERSGNFIENAISSVSGFFAGLFGVDTGEKIVEQAYAIGAEDAQVQADVEEALNAPEGTWYEDATETASETETESSAEEAPVENANTAPAEQTTEEYRIGKAEYEAAEAEIMDPGTVVDIQEYARTLVIKQEELGKIPDPLSYYYSVKGVADLFGVTKNNTELVSGW